jgi:class 3 adenylate cyclase
MAPYVELVRLRPCASMAEERVNRKLVAILAADVVGYSRLMEADESGTHPGGPQAAPADYFRSGSRRP